MNDSISMFEKIAFELIAELSYEEKCSYCEWCANRLHSSYASLLAEKLSAKVAADINFCRNELKKAVELRSFLIDSRLRRQVSLYLMEITHKLDVFNSEDCAVLKLVESIDISFQVMATPKSDLVILMPLLSIEIIHTVLSNEYGYAICDINDVIEHELLQKEFEEQLERLKM